MSWVNAASAGALSVDVATTSSGGHPPEFWADRCVERLIQISETAPAPIREQAEAFREQAKHLILLHMRRAIQSDRTTVAHTLTQAGHPLLADTIRRL